MLPCPNDGVNDVMLPACKQTICVVNDAPVFAMAVTFKVPCVHVGVVNTIAVLFSEIIVAIVGPTSTRAISEPP